MPNLDHLILSARDIAADPAAVLPILTGLLVALGLWTTFGTGSKADKTLCAKWSITPSQLAALQGPASNVFYRLLNLACGIGPLSGLLWFLCLFLVPGTHESPLLEPWPIGCVAVTMVSLGASMAFFARSTFYATALSRALSQHGPAEGVTAAGIAAGIDRHTIARSAWQIRLMGVNFMLLPAFLAFTPVLRQILNRL